MFHTPGPGRPKGMSNKVTLEVRDAARSLVDDPEYRASLKSRMTAGAAPQMETLMWHYAYGKPKETIEVKDTTNELEVLSAQELESRALTLAMTARELLNEADDAIH